ncbi:MAG: GerMN domain-containing protein [Candidatus Pelethousia sp.]|nr:GerMN domain-containing protein [Candidatus Pelethousia sp.]
MALSKCVYVRVVSFALGICLLFCGCGSSVIAEDRVKDDLPLLDPKDGVAKDVSVELYYRLTGEAYLVPITRNVSVRANERTETAIIRTLLEGVPQQTLSSNVSALFPAGTSIVDVSLDSGILYVTLSPEFLDESIVESVRRAGNAFGSYEAALQRAEEELYLTRRLGIYSLVNTLTGYVEGKMRVQILVDTDGTGKGSRLPMETLGLSTGKDLDSDLIEPLDYHAEAVVSPERIVSCMLSRMVNGEFEMAYALFMEAAAGGVQKPTYANFETEMLSLGNITGFTILLSNETEEGTAVITANLDFKNAVGDLHHIENAEILLKREGDLYKIGYGPFKSILEAAS